MPLLQPSDDAPEELFRGGTREPASVTASFTAEALPAPAGEIIVLRLGGEVDLLTVPELAAALDGSLDQRPAHLVVDLARLQFCSARGMGLLVRADVTAAERRIGYAISAIPRRLHRIWNQLWQAEMPPCYPSTAAAVTAIRAASAHRPPEEYPSSMCN